MKKVSLTAISAQVSFFWVILFSALFFPACSSINGGSTEPEIEETSLQETGQRENDAPVADTVKDETEEAATEEDEAAALTDSAAETSEEVEATEENVQTLSSVEILWQVPGEAVEFYYLRYGIEETNLDSKNKLAVKDLEKIDHPEHGPLFRHVVNGVPAADTIYFTIQAENQFGLSPESPVQQVESE